jgi:head-tail adaptor
MQAGKLRHIITVLRKSEGAQNTYGEPAVTWASLGTFAAEVLPLSGREKQIAQQTWAEAGHAIRMRVQPSITFRRADGVVQGDWDGVSVPALDILDVQDFDGRKRELRMTCREHKT